MNRIKCLTNPFVNLFLVSLVNSFYVTIWKNIFATFSLRRIDIRGGTASSININRCWTIESNKKIGKLEIPIKGPCVKNLFLFFFCWRFMLFISFDSSILLSGNIFEYARLWCDINSIDYFSITQIMFIILAFCRWRQRQFHLDIFRIQQKYPFDNKKIAIIMQ